MTTNAEPLEPITPEQFIDVVYRYVYLSAVEGTITSITDPPGSKPHESLMEMHHWFMQLDEPDRAMVERVASDAADGAVFGLLCMLDNVRPITDGFREELLLKIVSDGVERNLVPDDSYEDLHDLFRGRVDEGS